MSDDNKQLDSLFDTINEPKTRKQRDAEAAKLRANITDWWADKLNRIGNIPLHQQQLNSLFNTTKEPKTRKQRDAEDAKLRANIADWWTGTSSPTTLASAVNNSALGKEYGPDLPPKASEKVYGPEPRPSTPKTAKPSKLGLTGSVPPAPPGPPEPTETEPTLAEKIAQSFIRQSQLKRTEPTTKLYSGDDARTRAEERLERAETSAAYGQIASQIGNSLAQLFAAQKGLKEGVDLSNIKTTTPDFKAFLDSAATRYKTALDNEARKEGLSLQERDREQRRLDIAFADAINNETLSRAGDEFLLRQEQDAAAKASTEKARKEQLALGYAQLGATRDAARSKGERETKKDLKTLIDQISKEEKTLEEKALAARQVANVVNIINDPNQPPKTKEALSKQLASLIARAGLDPLVVADAEKTVAKAYGWGWRSPDNEAIKDALDTITESSVRKVAEKEKELQMLQGYYGGAPVRTQPDTKRAQPVTDQVERVRLAKAWLVLNQNHPDAPAIRKMIEGK